MRNSLHKIMKIILGSLAIALATLSIASLTQSAQAADYNHKNPTAYTTPNDRIPYCDATSSQSAVASRIAKAFYDYYEGRELEALHLIQETGYRIDNPSPLARRYCQAAATLSDGQNYQLYFSIVEDLGLFGVTWDVEVCILGLDKYHVYGGKCRVVRPPSYH